MGETTTHLITVARSACGGFLLVEAFSTGSVGVVILTAQGSIYTGICIDLACELWLCAKATAGAEALKHRETHISAVVVVSKDGILPPCGCCREIMVQVNVRSFDCRVIVGEDHPFALRELLPNHRLIQSTQQLLALLRRCTL